MQTNKSFVSIKWRFIITYVIVVFLAFLMLSFIGTRIFTDNIVNQRIDEQQKDINSLSVSVSPYLAKYDSAYINDLLLENSRNKGGRYLVLNQNGVVLFDTFSKLCGVKVDQPEVYDILYTDSDFSYGFHRVKTDSGNKVWTINYTTAIVSEYDTIGIVMYSQSIQDLIDKSYSITKTFISITILTSVIIIFITLFLSDYIIRPIIELRDFASKISRGDLRQRIKIEGNNEISSLGETFNLMSERIENMDNAKTEFVSNASHELKTPLSSMKILAQSLLYQENVPNEVYKDFLSDIDNEMDRLNEIISDLLLLTKIEDEQSALNLSNISVVGITQKVINNIKPIADNKDIKVVLSIEDLSIITADALKLQICISNIISNAVKYTDNGGSVNVRISSNNEGYIVLEVADTGVGMEQDELKKIFERFYRVDKARARKTGGTGLGLHIAKRIANLHNGDIFVESVPNEGSVFTLLLPNKINEELDYE